jgi:hypothetical protein
VLRSAVADGYIDAVIQPPTRRPPARIVLRVRHPAGQPMRSVTVDTQSHDDFDAAAQRVYIVPTDKPITIRIHYLATKACPHSQTFLRAGTWVPHCGHVFSHALGLALPIVALTLAASFFSAARHIFLGASAWTIAHCGWMPSQE